MKGGTWGFPYYLDLICILHLAFLKLFTACNSLQVVLKRTVQEPAVVTIFPNFCFDLPKFFISGSFTALNLTIGIRIVLNKIKNLSFGLVLPGFQFYLVIGSMLQTESLSTSEVEMLACKFLSDFMGFLGLFLGNPRPW